MFIKQNFGIKRNSGVYSVRSHAGFPSSPGAVSGERRCPGQYSRAYAFWSAEHKRSAVDW